MKHIETVKIKDLVIWRHHNDYGYNKVWPRKDTVMFRLPKGRTPLVVVDIICNAERKGPLEVMVRAQYLYSYSKVTFSGEDEVVPLKLIKLSDPEDKHFGWYFRDEVDSDNFWEKMFDAYDGGGDSHRLINGKPCVYWTEGMWISKDGMELDEGR